jgi:hypothetical protein
MRVLLDDRPLEVSPPTIANALEVARRTADADGRVVIEVLGDGRSVDQRLLDHPPADSAGFAELKLVTADPGLLVSVTLSDAVAVLDEASAAHAKAADALLSGRVEEAIEPLRAALEAWALIRDVVEKSGALLGLDVRTIPASGRTGSQVIDGLTGSLSEVKRALTEQDYSALSDVLAYDMPEQVDRWRELMASMERIAVGPRG